jgi:nucleotide-binding universal stress UspA family protein
MFKNLLVPLDGSAMAEGVIPAVVQLAKVFKTKIFLIHVIEKNAPSKIHGDRHLTESGQAQVYLNKIASTSFTPDLQVECHVHTSAVRDVAESIVQHSTEFEHDLIIMCSHGRGGARELLFGNIPVLLIHPVVEGIPVGIRWQRILIPLNEDLQHARSIPVAAAIARSFKASLYLLRVIPTYGKLSGEWITTSRFLPGTTERMLDEAVEDAQEFLINQKAELEQEGLSATIAVLRGEPAEVIGDSAIGNDIDLIVLGTHGKVGTDAFWSGSLMPKICARCKLPLLLVPVR